MNDDILGEKWDIYLWNLLLQTFVCMTIFSSMEYNCPNHLLHDETTFPSVMMHSRFWGKCFICLALMNELIWSQSMTPCLHFLMISCIMSHKQASVISIGAFEHFGSLDPPISSIGSLLSFMVGISPMPWPLLHLEYHHLHCHGRVQII